MRPTDLLAGLTPSSCARRCSTENTVVVITMGPCAHPVTSGALPVGLSADPAAIRGIHTAALEILRGSANEPIFGERSGPSFGRNSRPMALLGPARTAPSDCPASWGAIRLPAPAIAMEAAQGLTPGSPIKTSARRFFRGDIGANREVRDLGDIGGQRMTMVPIAAAMSGNIGEMPDSSVKLMSETAGMLREYWDSRRRSSSRTLKGHEVSAEEYKLVEAWKARQMKDPVFVQAYLSGGAEAGQKMTLAAIILSGGIKGQGRLVPSPMGKNGQAK